MVIARKLWMRRNQVVFGGDLSPHNKLLMEAETALMEFKRSTSSANQIRNSSLLTEDEKWVPPSRNTIKINWDAVVDTAKKIIGMGFIAAWDENGTFLAAASKQEQIEVEPVVAETLAALNVILWCQEQNFQNVIFEGDALQVVKDVNMDKHCSSYYGHLVEDVKYGLRRLNYASFCHVRCSANVSVHELASSARTHVTDVISWNVLPPNISGVVQRERSNSTS